MDDTILTLIAEHKETCAYCNRVGTQRLDPDGRPWTRDHVVPQSKRGSDELYNLVLACGSCNSRKRDTDQVAFALQLRHGLKRADARRVLDQSHASRVLTYISKQCDWVLADLRTSPATLEWSIVLRLPWPKDLTETITLFDRAHVDDALNRLNDASDHYWRTV